MSAPTSHDPVTVTTIEGTRWVRAAVTREGRGLYRPELAPSCPEFVMATLEELAEHGIKGQPLAAAVAELGALPVPVAGTPASRVAELEADLGRLRLAYASARRGRRWLRQQAEQRQAVTLMFAHRYREEADRAAELEQAAEAVAPDPRRAESVAKLRTLLARQSGSLEDPHDSPLHHDYEKCRDFPPLDETAQAAAEMLADRHPAKGATP